MKLKSKLNATADEQTDRSTDRPIATVDNLLAQVVDGRAARDTCLIITSYSIVVRAYFSQCRASECASDDDEGPVLSSSTTAIENSTHTKADACMEKTNRRLLMMIFDEQAATPTAEAAAAAAAVAIAAATAVAEATQAAAEAQPKREAGFEHGGDHYPHHSHHPH